MQMIVKIRERKGRGRRGGKGVSKLRGVLNADIVPRKRHPSLRLFLFDCKVYVAASGVVRIDLQSVCRG